MSQLFLLKYPHVTKPLQPCLTLPSYTSQTTDAFPWASFQSQTQSTDTGNSWYKTSSPFFCPAAIACAGFASRSQSSVFKRFLSFRSCGRPDVAVGVCTWVVGCISIRVWAVLAGDKISEGFSQQDMRWCPASPPRLHPALESSACLRSLTHSSSMSHTCSRTLSYAPASHSSPPSFQTPLHW